MTLISSISFHFIRPCDGASGVVGLHPCYSRTYNIGASSHPIPRPNLVLDTSWGYLCVHGAYNHRLYTMAVTTLESIDTKSRFYYVVLMYATHSVRAVTECIERRWRWSSFVTNYSSIVSVLKFSSLRANIEILLRPLSVNYGRLWKRLSCLLLSSDSFQILFWVQSVDRFRREDVSSHFKVIIRGLFFFQGPIGREFRTSWESDEALRRCIAQYL